MGLREREEILVIPETRAFLVRLGMTVPQELPDLPGNKDQPDLKDKRESKE